MSLYEKIVNREEKIAMTGLGYVGMPIAVAFSKKVDVIGYDMNEYKIEQYKKRQGSDPGSRRRSHCGVQCRFHHG